jgi:hypothetical protein
MGIICEVSDPEVVLKRLKNIMEMMWIYIYHFLKIRNILSSMKRVNSPFW